MPFISTLLKYKIFRLLLFHFEDFRSKSRLKQLTNILEGCRDINTLIDIGCGTGVITEKLHDRYQFVTGFDVVNHNLSNKIKFVLGSPNKLLPFNDKEFNFAIIIFVLHHSNDPKHLLKEVSRISNYVIIFEDIITNPVHKYYTYFIDSLINFEWFGHPHNNKTDEEWKNIFSGLGYQMIRNSYSYNFLGLKHARYFIKSTAL